MLSRAMARGSEEEAARNGRDKTMLPFVPFIEFLPTFSNTTFQVYEFLCILLREFSSSKVFHNSRLYDQETAGPGVVAGSSWCRFPLVPGTDQKTC